jgi:hypothetical protein
MDNLIEKLKNNTTPYALCSKDEQDCFQWVGRDNLLVFWPDKWHDAANDTHTMNPHLAYRIKPDYQPQPETVDLLVVSALHTFGKKCLTVLGCICTDEDIFIPLHELPSLPGFRGFWLITQHEPGVRIRLDKSIADELDGQKCIAECIDEGKTVIARLEL